MKSIPLEHPFQIIGAAYIIDHIIAYLLPLAVTGNSIMSAPDHKAVRISKLLVEELVPMLLLSDHGTMFDERYSAQLLCVLAMDLAAKALAEDRLNS